MVTSLCLIKCSRVNKQQIKTIYFYMSIKAQVLRSLLGDLPPANLYNFLVIIGRRNNSSISAFASKCAIPPIKKPSIGITFKGANFSLPAHVHEASGTINIGFHENCIFYVREQLRDMLFDVDNPMDLKLFDISIITLTPMGIPSSMTKLYNCWFTSRSELSLSHSEVTNPASWEGTFVYNGIEEKPVVEGTTPYATIVAEVTAILSRRALLLL